MSANILMISGSLRAGSFNTQLLQAAKALAPEGLTLSLFDLADIPLYNADLGTPDSVLAMRAAITEADGLLFSTPEYNYSIPGVLKNAIDWASRPAYTSGLSHKPAAILSASPGFIGGARAQAQLRHVLYAASAEVFPWPEFVLGGAGDKLADGRLTDEASATHLTKLLAGYRDWLARR